MAKFILNIVLGLVLLTACKDDQVEDAAQQFQENFLLKTDFGVYVQGNALFVYQAGEHQLAFTSDGLRCRVQTDHQEKYIAVELTEKPVVGQMVKTQIKVKAVDGIASGEQQCQVLRYEGGKCWLWEPASTVGYLIRSGE